MSAGTTHRLPVLLVRHGRTPWNDAGLIQGHTDVPLGAAARRELGALRLPRRFDDFVWFASPLARAVETAKLLSGRDPRVDARLLEMDWGQWEGQRMGAIRQAMGEAAYRALAARGPDFRPPGGESPRALQARVLDWLAERAQVDIGVVAATHKGVVKAVLGLAFDWDLTGKSPVKLDWRAAHLFVFDPAAGRVELVQANIDLLDRDERPHLTATSGPAGALQGSGCPG